MAKSYSLILSCVLASPSVAFVASPSHNRTPPSPPLRSSPYETKVHNQINNDCNPQKGVQNRRYVLNKIISTAGLLSSASIASLTPQPSHATVMSLEATKKGTLASISRQEAEQRFRAGRESVQYLLDHYDEICEGGGDNVRRYLGTVGVTSGLFGIGKALKVFAEDVDDIVEYTELTTEIEKTIQQADGSAYMAIFTTTSTSGVPPEKYFKDAKIEIERCAKSMDEVAAMVGLKL